MQELDLDKLLNLDADAASLVAPIVQEALIERVSRFLDNPGKGFRSRLVEAGFGLVAPMETAAQKQEVAALASVIELVHAGSLIIDDIQDGSQIRRGQPCMYLEAGVPAAINGGSWLLFYALHQLSAVGARHRLELHGLLAEMIMRAHLGQSIDLSARLTSIRREIARDICLNAMKLKTGTIIALALEGGGILAGASASRRQRLRSLGYRLGVALQMFDDLGSLSAHSHKRYEDLILERPGWVFAHAAGSEKLEDGDYAEFLAAVRRLQEDDVPFQNLLSRHGLVEAAREEAMQELESCLSMLENDRELEGPAGRQAMHEICREISRSYNQP